jgi:hypothetical protein
MNKKYNINYQARLIVNKLKREYNIFDYQNISFTEYCDKNMRKFLVQTSFY